MAAKVTNLSDRFLPPRPSKNLSFDPHFSAEANVGGCDFSEIQPPELQWRALFGAALQESHLGKLEELMRAAEMAIFSRLQQLTDATTFREQQDIREGIRILRKLQVEKLGYPRWPWEISRVS